MSLTVHLPPSLEAELHEAAAEQRMALDETIVEAIEVYLSVRETDAVRTDPEARRSLAAAQAARRSGDIVQGVDQARSLPNRRDDG